MKSTITKTYLEKKHYVEHLNQREIAAQLGVTKNTVCSAFKRHGITTLYRRSDHKYNEEFFEHWSSEMAYILAFVLCDGCIRIAKDGQRQLDIELQKKDVSVLEFIRYHLCPGAKIRFRARYDKRTGKTYQLTDVRFFSPPILDSLIKFGIVPRKTGNEFMANVPKKFMRDYLRGLIDGDGSIGTEPVTVGGKKYVRPRLSIASASRNFLEDVNRLYFKGVGKITKATGNCWTVSVESRPAIIKILTPVYNVGFCLERKRAKFIEILEYDEKMKTNAISVGTLRGLAKAQFL